MLYSAPSSVDRGPSLFKRLVSRKIFLAAGAAGVAGMRYGSVQAVEPLPAAGSCPWVREWVSGGRIGRRLWIHVDCPSSADYAWAICPALYTCGLELPLNVSALGEASRNNVLPVRFLMTARFAGGHTLVLNVSPSDTARTTIRGDRGGIDIQDGRIRIEEAGHETKASVTRFFLGLEEGQVRTMDCATEILRLGLRALTKG